MAIIFVKAAALLKKSIETRRQFTNAHHLFVHLPLTVCSCQALLYALSQKRLMTTNKRVQDRSRNKRVNDLEIATEKWKVFSKVLFLMELLRKEPEMIIPVRSLEQYRRQFNLPKPHKISDFIRKSPKLFELYKDERGVLWCGMTKAAEDLLEEERLIEEHSTQAVEHVTRFLMMSVDKRLPLGKIAHFRRDFGLPPDFRKKWVHQYPSISEWLNQVMELSIWNLCLGILHGQ